MIFNRGTMPSLYSHFSQMDVAADIALCFCRAGHFDDILRRKSHQRAMLCPHIILACVLCVILNSVRVLLIWRNKEGKMADQQPRARLSLSGTVEMQYCYISYFYCQLYQSKFNSHLELQVNHDHIHDY